MAEKATDVAIPDAFVMAVFTPPAKAPLAPLPGAVKVTVAPLTGLELESFTTTTIGAAKTVLMVALCGDPLDEPAPAVDLVLVGDLFYEAGLAARATAFLDRCRLAGIGALVGDPWRAHLPRARLKPLAEYRLADFGDAPDATATASAVFAFV